MRHCWIVCLVVACGGTAFAQPKLAVMPLLPAGVEVRIATALTDILAVELSRTYRVISRDEIAGMLGLEELKQAMGCDDVSCTTEIAGALGVDYLVTGNVTRLADKVQLKLTLFDTRQMQVLARTLERTSLDEDTYEGTIVDAVAHLHGASGGARGAVGGVLLGLAGGGAIGGIAFAVAASRTRDELEAGGLYQDEVDALQQTLRARQVGMGVSFGVAAASAIVGIILLATGDDRVVVAPVASRRGAGLVARARF